MHQLPHSPLSSSTWTTCKSYALRWICHLLMLHLTLVLPWMHSRWCGIYPETFSNIIIHLGDFHLMKEIFSILGILIQGSGFEEIIFQSGLCTPGSPERRTCWIPLQSMLEDTWTFRWGIREAAIATFYSWLQLQYQWSHFQNSDPRRN